MQLETGYFEDERFRAGLNRLTRTVYGFDFEAWHRGGFSDGSYIPFTYFEGDTALCNVSANEQAFELDGRALRLVQLGTVMTAPEARGQGLARDLMVRVLSRYEGACDGIFLFANDSVLDFYPRFGFKRAREWQHCFTVPKRRGGARKLSMDDPAQVQRVAYAMKTFGQQARLALVRPAALGMFYAAGFMQGDVYEVGAGQIALARYEEAAAVLVHLFGDGLGVREAAACLARRDGERVRLGFTPEDAEDMETQRLREEDTTLFVRGFQMPEGVRFPELSHA